MEHFTYYHWIGLDLCRFSVVHVQVTVIYT
jgi:hypothetical protein